jgi:hypothetical protein
VIRDRISWKRIPKLRTGKIKYKIYGAVLIHFIRNQIKAVRNMIPEAPGK